MAEVYNIGVGIADVTGPAAEIGMMGFAKAQQKTKGIHIRLYSRAFIFQCQGASTRIVFVSVDCGIMSQLVKRCVLRNLQEIYPGVYTAQNVLLSATHTHSGPAGYMQYATYNITSAGFVKETKEAMVSGIVKSICRAHDRIEPGHIYLSQGYLDNASVNRSPTSYLANPPEERKLYSHDTDHEMTQLNLFSLSGRPLGIINWFAVHPTSMKNSNVLISGDNKGAASQMFEKYVNKGSLIGKGPFVAAFASSNLGDVSPNLVVHHHHCSNYGLPRGSSGDDCNKKCLAFGPGKDMFESTKIIAARQFDKARQLFTDTSAFIQVRGPVKFVHQFIDMSQYEIIQEDGTIAKTAKPALGYSFAAGTIDGHGCFDFSQGILEPNPFWSVLSGLLRVPSDTQKICHNPKPILLDTGEYLSPYDWHPTVVDPQLLKIGQVVIAGVPGEFTTMAGRSPYDWHPTVVDPQLLKIGQVVIAGVPGEFTTMAGRRLRRSIETSMDMVTKEEDDMDECELKVKVVIAGLSNTYTHYITTFQEYQKQRYEAASTLYGPHTLSAYQQQYTKMATAIMNDHSLPEGPSPPDLETKQISFVPNVILDFAPIGKRFGQCIQQPVNTIAGQQVVVRFISGHLRNNCMLEKTFLTVERLVVNQEQRVESVENNQKDPMQERKHIVKENNNEEVIHSSLLSFERVQKDTKFIKNDNDNQRDRNERDETCMEDLNDLDWEVIATDADWETKLEWVRTNLILGESQVIITWDVPPDCLDGIYRIRHFGYRKTLLKGVKLYHGQTEDFQVVPLT